MENNYEKHGSSREMTCRNTARALELVNYVFKRTSPLKKNQRGSHLALDPPLESGEKDLYRLLAAPPLARRQLNRWRFREWP